MIKYILFDLDDTLCDYKGAQEKAKKEINVFLLEKNISASEFWKKFNSCNEGLFQQYVSKKITLDDYRRIRFSFKGLNVSDIKHINELYMGYANDNVELFKDVKPVFNILMKNNKGIAILTNGPSDGQRNKLKCLNLLDKEIKIFISSEIGSAKPCITYFEFVLKNLCINPEEALMIGDSIENDYFGAKKAGINSLLLDRNNICKRTDVSIINGLNAILEYLNV